MNNLCPLDLDTILILAPWKQCWHVLHIILYIRERETHKFRCDRLKFFLKKVGYHEPRQFSKCNCFFCTILPHRKSPIYHYDAGAITFFLKWLFITTYKGAPITGLQYLLEYHTHVLLINNTSVWYSSLYKANSTLDRLYLRSLYLCSLYLPSPLTRSRDLIP